MGYIDNNLMKDEQVVYRASLHWAIYLPAIEWAILGIVIAIIAASGQDLEDLYIAAIFFFILAVIALVRALLNKASSDFAVTNKRLILKEGIIARSTVELMLTKCEGVALDLGVLGRILGYGTLLTTTGGVTNKFKKIKDPVIFRNYINNQIDEAQHSK